MASWHSWEEKKAEMYVAGIEASGYDIPSVLDKEWRIYNSFMRHKELWIAAYPEGGHEKFMDYVFNYRIYGHGILDVGTGKAGIFCRQYLQDRFATPWVCTDAYDCNTPIGWVGKKVLATQILPQFGPNTFDYVQCIETMEHIPERDHEVVLKQLLLVSRRFVLVTSMGIFHHLGEGNKKLCDENPYMSYKGQPDPELFLKLGFEVMIMDEYSVVAWYDKNKTKLTER